MTEASRSSILKLAQQIHPEYTNNKLIRGGAGEFIRPLRMGLYVSYNYVRRSSRGPFKANYTYTHCFCLTFSLIRPRLLQYPLHMGSRFNDNHTLKFQLRAQNKLSKNVSDNHMGRKGWEDMTLQAMTLAEEELLPVYLAQLKSQRDSLKMIAESTMALLAETQAEAIDISAPPADLDAVRNLAKARGRYTPHNISEHDIEVYHLFNIASQLFGLGIRILLKEEKRIGEKLARQPNMWPPALYTGPSSSAVLAIKFFAEFEKDRTELPGIAKAISQLYMGSVPNLGMESWRTPHKTMYGPPLKTKPCSFP
ncbi:hypothetical protein [Pelagibius sp. Alg239-R121]|uniref:hypothetical protein n=1 Tax=Pelagibius sp. Alg239-R121 TaxID=2993448 RepID=UPI0024A77470|nr:hypothetical protein [Pelagibius sp. Alg239-R121]